MEHPTKEASMRRSIQAVILALALIAGFAVGVSVAPQAEAAGGGTCWTTCCEHAPWMCITCCKGQACPDVICP
jgi:hypothetical protein